MIWIQGNSFNMGSNIGKRDEKPVHPVKLNSYYIGKYEVTQALWKQVMGRNPVTNTQCLNCPVYDVKPFEIDSFIKKLNTLTGLNYRLPTEAEWEYAATGGSQSKGYKYCGSDNLDEVSWYAPNSGMVTHPIGQKKPNELGIYDMSGNVWELCQDWYKGNFYKHSAAENPVNKRKSMYRLVRGGSWRSEPQRCESHARNVNSHDHHISNLGFRLVR